MAEEPHLGRFHPGRALGVVLYLLLFVALAVALLGDRAEWLPPSWRATAPVAFGLFLLIFAVYRAVLIRAGRYPFGRALFQVGAGVLFLAVLLHVNPPSPAVDPGNLSTLLESSDPLVRRLACELARYRPAGALAVAQVRAHAESDVPLVRAECARSLEVLSTR